MEHDDKVRNELQRLLDGVRQGIDGHPANAAGGVDAEGETEFSKEDQKALRRMLIRV